jgi:hypothetical protein
MRQHERQRTSLLLLVVQDRPDLHAQQQSGMLALHVTSHLPNVLVLDDELTTTSDATISGAIGLSEQPIAAQKRRPRSELDANFPFSELAGNITIAPIILWPEET